MKILITGGSGLAGRNFQEVAFEKGIMVLAPPRSVLDLRAEMQVRAMITAMNPDVVIHFAALAGGLRHQMESPLDFFEHNIKMGMNLINACQRLEKVTFINIASAACYPTTAPSPLREADLFSGQLDPIAQPYGVAKMAVCLHGELVAKQNPRFRFKTLFPSNLYGPFDKFDDLRAHFLPKILRQLHEAKNHNDPLFTIGGNPSAWREALHAKDLASGILFAIDRFNELPAKVNIGSGDELTISDYHRLAVKIVGFKGQLVHPPVAGPGAHRRLLDSRLLRGAGWRPTHTLREGLTETYEYLLSLQSTATMPTLAHQEIMK